MITPEMAEKFKFMKDQGSKGPNNLKGIPLGPDGRPDVRTPPLLTEQMEAIQKMVEKLKPVSSQEYLKDPENIPLDEEGGVIIIPDQGFVFKTKEKYGGKMFINVVHHPLIDKPEEKEMVDLQNEQGIRIPMSLGRIRDDVDKQRKPCKVVDVIINPQVCLDIKNDKSKELANFFRQLLVTYIHQKHKIELSLEDFKIPKLTYKGNYVDFQRVRGKKQPNIQVVETQVNQENLKKQDIAAEQAKGNIMKDRDLMTAKIPDWTLYLLPKDDEEEKMEFDGFNFNHQEASGFVIEIQLPLMTTGKFFNLQTSHKSVYLKCGRFYELSLTLPLNFDKDNVSGLFDIERRVLVIEAKFLEPRGLEKKEDEEGEGFKNSENGPNIIEVNTQKIKDKNIDLKSDLLSDLVQQ